VVIQRKKTTYCVLDFSEFCFSTPKTFGASGVLFEVSQEAWQITAYPALNKIR
jgi:hypothetical protein